MMQIAIKMSSFIKIRYRLTHHIKHFFEVWGHGLGFHDKNLF